MKYERMHVCRISRESRAGTCGYWFLVYAHGFTSHCAFRTRKGLDLWLSRLGLKLTGPLDKAGDHCRIDGEYRRMYIPQETLLKFEGVEFFRELHNGEYVDAAVLHGGGEHVLYVAHPGATKHNYAESQRLNFGDWDDDEERACRS